MAVQNSPATEPNRPARPSWRGETAKPPAQKPRQWEGGANSTLDSHFRASRRRWRLRVAAFLALSLLLTVCFLALVLHTPQQTPLIAVAATDYRWPWQPNAWASEDLAGLQRLEGQTIQFADKSRNWQSRQHVLADWRRTLERVARQRSYTNAAVFYLSLHGAVTADGTPCLVPPGASPHDPREWVTIEELLRPMHDLLPEKLGKLLILDSNRQLTNWNAGILHNTFVQRLESVVEKQAVPHLLVLNSTSTHETAWASSDLRGSVFGRMVLLGLAGAADRSDQGPVRKALAARDGAAAREGGNDDGVVSARELYEYVRERVSSWAASQRGVHQTPRLMPKNQSDFPLVWSLRPSDLRRLDQALASAPTGVDSEALEAQNRLWTQLDTIRPIQPESASPLVWHDWQNQLLWLEQLLESGRAYSETVRRVQQALSERMTQAVTRVPVAADQPDWANRLAVLESDRLDWPRTLPVRSAALRRQLGLSLTGDSTAAASNNNSKAPALATPDVSEVWDDAHFKRLAQAYHLDRVWTDPAIFDQTLTRRQQLETLAARHDVRAQPWVRPWLDATDLKRRVVEDAWYLGESSGVSPAAELESLVGETATSLAQVEAAWAMRDRAWAEIPYLARWLAHPPIEVQGAAAVTSDATLADAASTTKRDPINDVLPALLNAVHRLNESLEDAPSQPSERLPILAEQTAVVADHLKTLRSQLDAVYRELMERTEANAETYAGVVSALEWPHWTASQRVQLREKRNQMAEALAKDAAKAVAKAATSSATAAATKSNDATASATNNNGAENDKVVASEREWQRLLSWRSHPAMAILFWQDEQPRLEEAPSAEINTDPTATWARIERWGQQVRERLTVPVIAAQPAVESSAATLAAQRARDERDVRIAAAFGVSGPAQERLRVRRRYDVQRLLAWFAARTLDDCYGAGPRAPQAVSAPLPYFQRAVPGYLLATEMVATPDAELTAELAELRRRFDSYVTIASRGVVVSAVVDQGATTSDQQGFRVAISRAARRSSPPQPGSNFPSGEATVFLRDPQQQPLGSRAKLSIPLAAAEEVKALTAATTPANAAGLEAVMVFRGNEFRDRVADEHSNDLLVDVHTDLSRDARVTLAGDRLQQTSVVFILDCSASMATPIAVEAIGGQELPRLELAKAALAELLDQLAPRDDARVGVRFFGHRVGWTTEKPIIIVPQKRYPDPIPDDLLPSDDVEQFLPLGRFDQVEAGRVTGRMKALMPWGQSPLYRALLQARGDFDAEQPGTRKSVVVITDGENYQFNGVDSTVRGTSPTARDVIAAYQGRDIPIFILGFGIEKEPQEFLQVAQSTQGDYFSVQNGGDLLKVLRSRLNQGNYTVLDDRGQAVGKGGKAAGPTQLNLPVAVSGLGMGSRDYTLRFEALSTKMSLEGGESVTLRVDSQGRGIVADEYNVGLPVSDTLAAPSRPQHYTVRVHRPLQGESVVTLPVSFQDENLAFTPRPAEVWVEVTPVTRDGNATGGTYVFNDREFVPDQPVPVLHCRVPNWPAAASRAQVRVWMKSQPTRPVRSVPLADVVQGPGPFAEGFPIEEIDGVTSKVTIVESKGATLPMELRVTTRHREGGAEIDTVKLHMDGPLALRPRHMRHRYDHDRRETTHSFWYDSATWEQVKADRRVQIAYTTRAASREDAWRTPNDRPLSIEVSGNQETLPVDAATGPR